MSDPYPNPKAAADETICNMIFLLPRSFFLIFMDL